MSDPTIPSTESLLPLSDLIENWVARIIANRAVIEHLPETEHFTGKISGLPNIAALERTEGDALTTLRIQLLEYGRDLARHGKALPFHERAVVEVKEEVKRCIRLTVVRDLLMQRAGEWGIKRKKLPPHLLPQLLSEIDLLITRTATEMKHA